ncbi:PP2C family protein-serine/threonine phosphatase [Canibacter zhoujuaniae]|uniref:PP2C family protein-serine/threonine phosphatase n=1 Tax=Canibacter zhoujuaniae TaxID=2708343 RepID=UPI0014224C51|nr:PP2C family serine/threonine-protein phosphatase [Canibacter zhoujuaniae]
MTLNFDAAIASHVGLARSNNQDSGFSGAHLFFVADGMGGHAGGDVASATVTRFVADADATAKQFETAEDASEALRKQLLKANLKLAEKVEERPELSGLGTTFSGFFTVGNQLGVAHIGDSRLYLFRDGKLRQITSDHTFVQKLIDAGQITEDEARVHPRRSVLMRVLGDVDSRPLIDTEVLDAEAGDIYLLCSDGLCGYVDEKTITNELRRELGLQQTVDNLIDRTLEVGAPDNVTIALVRASAAPKPVAGELADTATLPVTKFVGSAARDGDDSALQTSTQRTRILNRRRRKVAPAPEAHFEPKVDEYLAELIAETKRRTWRRRAIWALGAMVAIALALSVIFVGYQWVQSRYYVGTDGVNVIIYQGIQADLGPISLNKEEENTSIPLGELGIYERIQVERTISANSLTEARDIVLRLSGGSE